MSESLSSQSKSNPAPFNPASIKASTSKRGIQFTETMRGYFSPDEKDDFDAGYAQGKKNNTTFDFSLTIQSLDLDEMINNEGHDASISGIVNAATLSPEPLIVTGGVFNCFVTDITNVNTRNMRYSMIFSSEAGEKYYFYGYKVIHDDLGFDAWSDTTTLYFTIWEGENDQGTIAGKGILKISPADFAKQMSTITALNVNTKSNKLKAIADFGYFFSKNLYEVYGSVLSQSNSYDPGAPPRIKRPLKMNPPEVFYFNTKDNTQLRLTRYKGGTKGPVLVSPGFGTSILAYTIDTVDTNFPEFLYENGYDIWLFDYRASPALKSGSTQFTLDDIAAFDYPAAVDKVIEVTGAENIQVMAHCIGSLTFLMSMCIGLKSIRSAVCSQLTAHPVGPFLSELKSGLYLATLIKTIGIKLLTTDYDPNSWKDRLFDQLLKLYPTKQPV
ncbi:MAG: hypothetical protein OEX07_08665, partial [Gammaproteobacteria bacterium]|nr:hypothetical protein [Gammaproteobacteria bacterium]